jgi:hypothetical protein
MKIQILIARLKNTETNEKEKKHTKQEEILLFRMHFMLFHILYTQFHIIFFLIFIRKTTLKHFICTEKFLYERKLIQINFNWNKIKKNKEKYLAHFVSDRDYWWRNVSKKKYL